MKNHAAPWSRILVMTTLLTSLFCVGICVLIPHLPRHGGDRVVAIVRWFPAALVVICALFSIRGYCVTSDAILIRRLLWTNRIARKDLVSAKVEPGAMKGSVRTCGNGGFFSFSGYFRNQRLGSYTAMVTDLQRTVVLRCEKKVYVLSPADPEAFVKDLKLPTRL